MAKSSSSKGSLLSSPPPRVYSGNSTNNSNHNYKSNMTESTSTPVQLIQPLQSIPSGNYSLPSIRDIQQQEQQQQQQLQQQQALIAQLHQAQQQSAFVSLRARPYPQPSPVRTTSTVTSPLTQKVQKLTPKSEPTDQSASSRSNSISSILNTINKTPTSSVGNSQVARPIPRPMMTRENTQSQSQSSPQNSVVQQPVQQATEMTSQQHVHQALTSSSYGSDLSSIGRLFNSRLSDSDIIQIILHHIRPSVVQILLEQLQSQQISLKQKEIEEKDQHIAGLQQQILALRLQYQQEKIQLQEQHLQLQEQQQQQYIQAQQREQEIQRLKLQMQELQQSQLQQQLQLQQQSESQPEAKKKRQPKQPKQPKEPVKRKRKQKEGQLSQPESQTSQTIESTDNSQRQNTKKTKRKSKRSKLDEAEGNSTSSSTPTLSISESSTATSDASLSSSTSVNIPESDTIPTETIPITTLLPVIESPPDKTLTNTEELELLLFDRNVILDTLSDFGVDCSKMPLEPKYLARVEGILKKLNDILFPQTQEDEVEPSRSEQIKTNAEVERLSKEFYALVPHVQSVSITTPEVLVEKFTLFEILLNVSYSFENMKKFGKPSIELLPNIKPVERASEAWEVIEFYLQSTDKCKKLRLIDIFELTAKKELNKNSTKETSNVQLLWHGEYLASMSGFLQRTIESLEFYSRRHLGNGLYFSNICSNQSMSSGYRKTDSQGLILLAEVELGETFETLEANHRYDPKDLPTAQEADSITGIGMLKPATDQHRELNGVRVPCGKLLRSGVKSHFTETEYMVSDPSRVLFKYLVRVSWDYVSNSSHST
eukprot:TRINITY_DN6216_c0_g2_i2.p1 TRINITY_DN6216_c0_g2~~TRINITY_DN6216_c0_g2_i2.p1  ORF type:complete len:862 (-),score=156.48 TRINITY_DN6216_c0_g2_i2:20-2494(-)